MEIVQPFSDDDSSYITGSGTATQVAFWSASKAISGSNSLSWDNGNNRLGIGTTSPNAKLESLSTTEQLRLSYDATHYSSFTVGSNGQLVMSASVAGTGQLRLQNTSTSGFSAVDLLDSSGNRRVS